MTPNDSLRVSAGGKSRSCRAFLQYLVGDDGYIKAWRCPTCDYPFKPPTYWRKRNVPAYKLGAKCYLGTCSICSPKGSSKVCGVKIAVKEE